MNTEYKLEYYLSSPGLARATLVQYTIHTDILEYSQWRGYIDLGREWTSNLKTCIAANTLDDSDSDSKSSRI